MEALEQGAIDNQMIELDGTPNKKRLGANAILGRVPGRCQGGGGGERPAAVPLRRRGTVGNVLPVPMMNILNGGEHADNNVDLQEFMVMPFGAALLLEALRMGTEVFHSLKRRLQGARLSTRTSATRAASRRT